MYRRHLISRTFEFCAWGATILLYATTGATDPSKAARVCSTAYTSATQAEQSGKLLQARDLFVSCAKAPCAGFMRQQCLAHYTQLELDIPSVVPLVTSDDGDPRVDVQVSVDNEPLTSHLDGRSLPVDPGMHEFSFSSEGKVIATQKVLILQGQRNRPISIALKPDKAGKKAALGTGTVAALDAKASPDKAAADRPPLEKSDGEAAQDKVAPPKTPSKTLPEARASEPPPVEPPKKAGRSAMPYVLGSVGLVGLGGAGLLTYWGRKDNDKLALCAPSCPQSSVDHVRKLYVASDVSLGVGVAALATSLVWFIASAPPKEEPAPQARYRFDVAPGATGTYATFSGSF